MSPSRRFRIRPAAIRQTLHRVRRHPANAAAPNRAVLRVVLAELRARATGRPVEVPVGRSQRILAHLHRGGSWRAVLANPPDHAEMVLWRELLGPGDLFVDVGANAGVYTLWALDCGARVVAVEPDPEMARQLRANLAVNGATAEVHEAALAASAGTARLGGPDLLTRRLLPDAATDGDTVSVTTLDDVLGDRHAHGVKIDVEGHERRVLEGATRALDERRIDVLQLEWNDTCHDALGEGRGPVAALLRAAGYVLVRPGPGGELGVEPDDVALGSDVFAVRPELLEARGRGPTPGPTS